MSLSILDSKIYSQSWVDPSVAKLLDEETKLQAWVEILVILATHQEKLNIIPQNTGNKIKEGLTDYKVNWEELRTSYQENGHSFQGLFDQLRKHLGPEGEYIGYGCTVQDITDTWLSGVLVKFWESSFKQLKEIEKSLITLIKEHKKTPMIGRTHGQWGAPITFGYKVSLWLQEIRRHLDRLKDLHPRIGFVQLGGSVGVMSGYGSSAFDLQKSFAQELKLKVPTLAWTNSRDSLLEFALILSSICGSLSKMGHEIYNLQRTEIGEVLEGSKPESVGSVTMPQKRNPEKSEQIGSLARIIRHKAAVLQESLVHEHERDGQAWKVEWAVWPEILAMTSACLKISGELFQNLEVKKERMLENLKSTQGLILSEALMMRLANEWGLASARQWVRDKIHQSKSSSQSLESVITRDQSLRAVLSESECSQFLDYNNHLGQSLKLCERALEISEKEDHRDQEFLEKIKGELE